MADGRECVVDNWGVALSDRGDVWQSRRVDALLHALPDTRMSGDNLRSGASGPTGMSGIGDILYLRPLLRLQALRRRPDQLDSIAMVCMWTVLVMTLNSVLTLEGRDNNVKDGGKNGLDNGGKGRLCLPGVATWKQREKDYMVVIQMLRGDDALRRATASVDEISEDHTSCSLSSASSWEWEPNNAAADDDPQPWAVPADGDDDPPPWAAPVSTGRPSGVWGEQAPLPHGKHSVEEADPTLGRGDHAAPPPGDGVRTARGAPAPAAEEVDPALSEGEQAAPLPHAVLPHGGVQAARRGPPPAAEDDDQAPYEGEHAAPLPDAVRPHGAASDARGAPPPATDGDDQALRESDKILLLLKVNKLLLFHMLFFLMAVYELLVVVLLLLLRMMIRLFMMVNLLPDGDTLVANSGPLVQQVSLDDPPPSSVDSLGVRWTRCQWEDWERWEDVHRPESQADHVDLMQRSSTRDGSDAERAEDSPPARESEAVPPGDRDPEAGGAPPQEDPVPSLSLSPGEQQSLLDAGWPLSSVTHITDFCDFLEWARGEFGAGAVAWALDAWGDALVVGNATVELAQETLWDRLQQAPVQRPPDAGVRGRLVVGFAGFQTTSR